MLGTITITGKQVFILPWWGEKYVLAGTSLVFSSLPALLSGERPVVPQEPMDPTFYFYLNPNPPVRGNGKMHWLGALSFPFGEAGGNHSSQPN